MKFYTLEGIARYRNYTPFMGLVYSMPDPSTEEELLLYDALSEYPHDEFFAMEACQDRLYIYIEDREGNTIDFDELAIFLALRFNAIHERKQVLMIQYCDRHHPNG